MKIHSLHGSHIFQSNLTFDQLKIKLFNYFHQNMSIFDCQLKIKITHDNQINKNHETLALTQQQQQKYYPAILEKIKVYLVRPKQNIGFHIELSGYKKLEKVKQQAQKNLFLKNKSYKFVFQRQILDQDINIVDLSIPNNSIIYLHESQKSNNRIIHVYLNILQGPTHKIFLQNDEMLFQKIKNKVFELFHINKDQQTLIYLGDKLTDANVQNYVFENGCTIYISSYNNLKKDIYFGEADRKSQTYYQFQNVKQVQSIQDTIEIFNHQQQFDQNLYVLHQQLQTNQLSLQQYIQNNDNLNQQINQIEQKVSSENNQQDQQILQLHQKQVNGIKNMQIAPVTPSKNIIGASFGSYLTKGFSGFM